ncbi:uncharacterized protein LOC144785371 [Lissotriton helveticus]
MSISMSFKELVNLAIGTPEVGAVNFNALHCLLHGLLEHLHVSDIQRDIPKEEQDFIRLPLGNAVVKGGGDSSRSLFHHLQDRMSRVEKQLQHLNEPLSLNNLLEQTQASNQPVQEMWQLMQLRKKMEANEEGVTKAMAAFQELLNTFNNLRNRTNDILTDLDTLKNNVGKIDVRDIEERLRRLEEQSQSTKSHGDRLESIQNKLNSYPEPADIVLWTSLHDAVLGKGSELVSGADSKTKNAKEILNRLGQMPSQQEALEKRITEIENELRKQAEDIANVGVPEDLLEQLKDMKNEINMLQAEDKKDKAFLKDAMGRLQQLSQSCDNLNVKTEKIITDMGKFQNFQQQINELDSKKMDKENEQELKKSFQRQLNELDSKKMDKEMLELQLNTKADKKSVDGKVSHAQMEVAVAELNAILEDLIKKMSLHEDWQKMLEKLLHTVDSKLDRSELESLRKDLDELWSILKKHLNDGHFFDSDSAAGFRKKLFERVKCISCDRPVTMMTAPHLVTVRSSPLQPRPRPNSAMDGEIRDDVTSERMFDVVDQAMRHCGVWQCSTSCPGKRPSKSQNLTTLYPYGDPGSINYKNNEVDVIGVDGVLYKGRLDSKNNRHSMPERDFTVKKTPRPPTRNIPERARSATPHTGRHSPPIPTVSSLRSRQPGSLVPNSSFFDIQDPEIRVNMMERPASSGDQLLTM